MKKKLLISFSGGRTSAFMTQWLLKNKSKQYEMIVVFANTGKEREETLEFVQKCDSHFGFNLIWVETKMNIPGVGAGYSITNFESANRNGQPFENVIAKHGIPNQTTPHCSRELKGRPIQAFAKSIGWEDYYTAIGYRSDELHRVNRKSQKALKLLYPLVDEYPMTRELINGFWSLQPFNLELKSYEGNCDLCWKKNVKKHLTIINDNPEVLKWWRKMEVKYENYTPESRLHNPKIKPPHRFFRENRSCNDLLEMSQKYFEPAEDETASEIYRQALLFDQGIYEGCEESCEPDFFSPIHSSTHSIIQ